MENYLFGLIACCSLLWFYCGFIGLGFDFIQKQKHRNFLFVFIFAFMCFIFWVCDITEEYKNLNKKPTNQETQCS